MANFGTFQPNESSIQYLVFSKEVCGTGKKGSSLNDDVGKFCVSCLPLLVHMQKRVQVLKTLSSFQVSTQSGKHYVGLLQKPPVFVVYLKKEIKIAPHWEFLLYVMRVYRGAVTNMYNLIYINYQTRNNYLQTIQIFVSCGDRTDDMQRSCFNRSTTAPSVPSVLQFVTIIGKRKHCGC